MLQALLNKFISLDPGIDHYLTALQGKQLAIVCTDPAHTMFISFDNKQILLSSSAPDHVDVTITGKMQDFVKYALTKQRADLRVDGDAMLAALIEKLYTTMDIDWEEELSKLTGDAIAYQAGAMFRTLKNYTADSSTNLGAMISEYLQEESGILPTHYEVDAFLQEVDELRLRVDRLEARINAYESN
ncbi:MAG TPA: SCP2 sterol-binding domain-containing protein [Gammaproteobacteria bacterium]|nr:SCP2 sterol-binding domain-containing protein [Gammaproteobacteria bacterium]